MKAGLKRYAGVSASGLRLAARAARKGWHAGLRDGPSRFLKNLSRWQKGGWNASR